jgi:hypothetical protein
MKSTAMYFAITAHEFIYELLFLSTLPVAQHMQRQMVQADSELERISKKKGRGQIYAAVLEFYWRD